MQIKERIFLEENELKPNRNVANVLLFCIPLFILVELLNEFGVFHVVPITMHIGIGIGIFCSLLGQYLGRNRKIACHRQVKYVIMVLIFIEVLAMCIVLAEWTELLIVLPILLGIQYHNRGVTYFSIALTFIIAFASAPLGVLCGTTQVDYYAFLVRTTGHVASSLEVNPDFNALTYAGYSLLYMSFPRCLIVCAYALVATSISRFTHANIKNRAEIAYLSSTDVLTGVYNRMSYENKLREYRTERPQSLICIYTDADGLHELNNRYGHEAGDDLLQTCATQMREHFGRFTFRLGGDEFLSFVEDKDLDQVGDQVREIENMMTAKGYHASMGVQELEPDMSIDDMVRTAEEDMFAKKRNFYLSSGKDRRRSRSGDAR